MMLQTILDKIFAAKRLRVEEAKRRTDALVLKKRAFEKRSSLEPHRLRFAMQNRGRINIIAEFKKASPSKGIINDALDAASVARRYEAGRSVAISVLTEEDFFNGTLDDLRAVCQAVDLPILRKDFVFDEFQIYEAAEAGADAILLITAMLDYEALEKLHSLAENELGMDALVEVHTVEELKVAQSLGAKLIGVNNRDLNSFDVSLDVSRELIKYASTDTVMISESGLKNRNDLIELLTLGYSGFLIGEALMRSGNSEAALRMLTAEHTEFV
ncbi:MAG: indole-3-glycerol phosphate synthase TrpC [Blastocatellia bacterium]